MSYHPSLSSIAGRQCPLDERLENVYDKGVCIDATSTKFQVCEA
jgi:hypothetical protein